MSGPLYRWFGVVSGIGVLLLVFVLSAPATVLAQQQAQDGYAGAEACKGCHEEAPSTRALSYSSCGIDCRPARRTSIMNGVLCQTSTSTTAKMETAGVENQSK